ncbi:MAG: zinc ribbon domain-containing protein [Armatimonadota bacterium]|nr:MAG: zinc ribbon domain-containing protein [Armatimonadota bacterium]
MSGTREWLAYAGRLVIGKLREWWRLLAVSREMHALEERRDELLLRLGKRYHQYLTETSAEPVPAVAETTHDLRILLQRVAALNDMKEHIRQEQYLYVHPELVVELPPSATGEPEPPPVASAQRTRAQDRGESIDFAEMPPARRGPPRLGADRVCECGETLPPRAKFCPACGKAHAVAAAKVSAEIAPPRKCPNCGTETPLGAEFCPECGGHIDAEVYEM